MTQNEVTQPTLRHDWKAEEVEALFSLPFPELLFQAHSMHRQCFDPRKIQASTLLSIKTGACPEDCAYCPQSARHKTGLEVERLFDVEQVLASAKNAKDKGATRFCMGAGWRTPKEKDFVQVLDMVKAVKALGLETCITVGMLNEDQAQRLGEVGLDYYNHNLDSSPEFYKKIITTRTYQDRLDTLANIRKTDVKVCCGGIVGMGEAREDRVGLLLQLANLPTHPESVPINLLVKVKGTPLGEQSFPALPPIEFVRTIACARVMMPKSVVRLSAGREGMSEEMQAMCFFAGANSIFYGEKLLTTPNPDANEDIKLLESLGMVTEQLPGDVPQQAATTGA